MIEDRLKTLWNIYLAASQVPREAQLALIQSQTDDPELVREVLSLLESRDAELADPVAPQPSGPPESGIHIGTKIGRYLITGVLGRGGMSDVYSVQDTELARPVALKVIRADREGNPGVRRFIREARAASALNHSNIVTIHEVIRSEGAVAIAMELVEGSSLRQLCGEPVAMDQLLSWGKQIARALVAAHSRGIIHQDIKPENVMVRPDGQVKVLDFGLAHHVDVDSWNTSMAVPTGTLRYMSPEQTRAEPLTGASDVFSLGLMLYELVSGRHPFAAQSPIETAHLIASSTPAAPSSHNSFVPASLDALILLMLSKDPAARPTAQEVADAIARLAAGSQASVSAPSTTVGADPSRQLPSDRTHYQFSPNWAVLAGIAILLVSGALVWFYFVKRSDQRTIVAPSPDGGLILAAGPDDPIPPRHFYGVRPDGNLTLYVDDSHDEGGTARWIAQSVSAPPIAGVNFAQFRSIIGGGDGILYGIGADGSVTYFRLIDPWRNKGSVRWSADSNVVIGFIPSTSKVISGFSRPIWNLPDKPAGTAKSLELVNETALIRGGLIWASVGNKTELYQHGWNAGGQPAKLVNWSNWWSSPRERSPVPQWRGPSLPPNEACRDCLLIEGGTGLTFAMTKGGELWRYRLRAGEDAWAKAAGTFKRSQFATEVGHSWNVFRTIVAEPGEYQIEGYVSTEKTLSGGDRRSSMSVEPGESVKVRVSTFSPSYSVRLLRLQRHRSKDREQSSGLIDGYGVGLPVTREAPAGGNFKKPQHSGMHATGAGWASDGPDIRLPRDARSGIYAAELTTPSGSRYLAPFVVKPPADRHNRIAIIANVSTWNAYNQWGGGSRFAAFQPAQDGQPYELSYERPLAESPLFGGVTSAPGLTDRARRQFNQLVRAEVWITSWMDELASSDGKYGYDVFTDVDLDQGVSGLASYRAVILNTLPEFWTDKMRDQLDAYLNAGGHLIYMGSRGLMKRISLSSQGRARFEKGPGGGCELRKNDILDCPAEDLFRWPNARYPDGRSERAVLGLASEFIPQIGNPLVAGAHFVVAAQHPFLFANTGLSVGSAFGELPGLNGGLPVVDGRSNSYFSLGHCPDQPNERCGATHTTHTGRLVAYSAPNDGTPPITRSSVVFRKTEAGGWVLSVGSISAGGVLAIDPTLQHIIKNALDDALSSGARQN